MGQWNRFCFLIGAGGTGKSTLADLFMSNEKGDVGKINEVARTIIEEDGIGQSDLANDRVFWDLQIKIAQKQLDEERSHESSGSTVILSDRSVVDALVYSVMRFPVCNKAGCKLDKKRAMFNRLCELVGNADCAHEILVRYQTSIVILVNPFDHNDSIDDNVRLLMSSAEMTDFTAKCRLVLQLFEVPFLDLKERSKEGRLKLLLDTVTRVKEDLCETITQTD